MVDVVSQTIGGPYVKAVSGVDAQQTQLLKAMDDVGFPPGKIIGPDSAGFNGGATNEDKWIK
jgi:hypothetical protein